METIIRTENLTKRYKDVLAVSDMSLNVGKGEIYGFLGLNGAGKTTTIRMLLGMIAPDSGHAYINGQKVHAGNTSLWRETGYLVEMPFSYPNLTVRENLEIMRRMRLVDDRLAVDKIMEKLQISKYANRLAKNLSMGNAQRLGVAKAMIHNPSILILDEPANGFDPAGIFEIRELLRDLSVSYGVTIFISSHILGEIAKFATRIGIIDNGVLIQEFDAPELNHICRKRLLVGTRDIGATARLLEVQGIDCMVTHDEKIEIHEENFINNPDRIASLLVNNQLSPTLLHVVEEDLESYFLRTIKKG